jgi:hypothetical protein
VTQKTDPSTLVGATGADRDQICGEQLLDTTNRVTEPALTEPLAAIGCYKLLAWEPCEWSTGRVGIATVLLPSGKLGGFAIYNLAERFAEWWPTAKLRRIRRRDHRELNAALTFAVALVRQYDPGALRDDGGPKPSCVWEAAE